MRFCVDVPNFGVWADPRRFADFAAQVEDAGWDGLSVWDHILVEDGLEVADPWILLAAAAMRTERIRLMTMVTPLPRRHPWKLARETVTLDLLSEGRLILGVGIGWPTDPEFARFDGPEDLRVRADMLDEGLDILNGLWSGAPFSHDGEHYRLAESVFAPVPVQQPRIPIWAAAMWPARRPVRRAARWDGIVPIFTDADHEAFLEPTPERMEQVVRYALAHRTTDEPFDVAVRRTRQPGEQIDDLVARFASIGVTWWQDGWFPSSGVEHDDWVRDVVTSTPVAG